MLLLFSVLVAVVATTVQPLQPAQKALSTGRCLGNRISDGPSTRSSTRYCDIRDEARAARGPQTITWSRADSCCNGFTGLVPLLTAQQTAPCTPGEIRGGGEFSLSTLSRRDRSNLHVKYRTGEPQVTR